VSDAWLDFQRAAAHATVQVRVLQGSELVHAASLWKELWGDSVVERHLLTALAHSGNYVAGAFDSDRMVGAAAAFFGAPAAATMHSHVAGVAPGLRGSGVGSALKLHQRAWCLDRGVTRITWTFDPLVARNASFNINRLGVTCQEYLVNHYGDMTDGINNGDESDRFVARWHLHRTLPASSPRSAADALAALAVGPGDEPVATQVPGDAVAVSVAIPTDIESLRRTHPAQGLAWRRALRSTIGPLLESGWVVTGFAPEGHYILERNRA
jgi:predicted GNAT superfamily acetyltransferase